MRKQKFSRSSQDYTKKHPKKARVIKQAVRRGLKEYAETFRRLAAI